MEKMTREEKTEALNDILIDTDRIVDGLIVVHELITNRDDCLNEKAEVLLQRMTLATLKCVSERIKDTYDLI